MEFYDPMMDPLFQADLIAQKVLEGNGEGGPEDHSQLAEAIRLVILHLENQD